MPSIQCFLKEFRAFVLLACLVFTAVYRYAIRTGLIARYSAETVS